MGISDGQPVDAANSNPAWLDANADDQAQGKIDFINPAGPSGPSVINIQREINSLNSFTGRASGSAFNVKPAWVNNDVGSTTDDLETRTDLLTQRFNGGSGHAHTGSSGEGPQISGAFIANVPMFGVPTQATQIVGVTGGSTDVSTQLAGKSASTGSAVLGIPSTAPFNRVAIRNPSTGAAYVDTFGNEVYGRLTFSSPTWTLTYYSLVTGVETAYTWPGATTIDWYYQELFNLLAADRPVYSELFVVPSDTVVGDIPDASETQSGKVNTSGVQSFGGEKNFKNGIGLTRLDVASTATITALSSTGSFDALTGTTATTIQGITASTIGKRLLLYNGSTQPATIKNQNAGATAANRIITPGATDISVPANSSIEFEYHLGLARWIVVSSGAGSGTGSLGFQQSLGTANGVMVSFGPLTNTPLDGGSVIVFVDYIAADKSLWSLSGSNIVFGTAPAIGQQIYVWYLYSATPPTPVTPTTIEHTEYRTLSGGEAAAKQLTLAFTPFDPTNVLVDWVGSTSQIYGVDFTVSGTTLDWLGYNLDGVLVAGDILRIHYWS